MKRAATLKQLQAQWRRDPKRREAFDAAYYALARGVIDRTAQLDGAFFASDYFAKAMQNLHPDDRDFFNCASAHAFLKIIAGTAPRTVRQVEAAQMAARIFNDPLEARKYLPALWAFINDDEEPSRDVTIEGVLAYLQRHPEDQPKVDEFITAAQTSQSASDGKMRRDALDWFVLAVEARHPYATSAKKWGSFLRLDLPSIEWRDEKSGRVFGQNSLTLLMREEQALALAKARPSRRRDTPKFATAKAIGERLDTLLSGHPSEKRIRRLLDQHGRRSQKGKPQPKRRGKERG